MWQHEEKSEGARAIFTHILKKEEEVLQLLYYT